MAASRIGPSQLRIYGRFFLHLLREFRWPLGSGTSVKPFFDNHGGSESGGPFFGMGRGVATGVAVGAVLTVVLLWMTAVPLGVPGEWSWRRILIGRRELLDAVIAGVAGLAAAAVYLAVVWLGARRLRGCSRWESAGWLAGLVGAGFFWLSVVQGTPPDASREIKSTWVLYDPASSGYFFEACYRMEDAAAFLAGYEERMAQGDVLHVGTHPPGLFLFHYGLLRLCRSSPEFSRWVLKTQPRSVAESFSVLEGAARLAPFPLTELERAALWLASLLTQLAGVATVVPLYLLLCGGASRQTSWLAAAFWPLVPALAVFLPKSDALYPFLGMLFLWVWLEGWRRRSPWWCIAAGLVLWLGLFLSLALLPVALLAALLTVWEIVSQRSVDLNPGDRRMDVQSVPRDRRMDRQSERPGMTDGLEIRPTNAGRWRGPVSLIAWGAVGFLAAVAVLWILCDVNLLNVWLWNYRNHAGFYAQFPRTYWKWLLVNPLELALGVGLPIVVWAAAASVRAVRTAASWRDPHLGPYWACALVWALLWLSGKNMGEAARLWLFLMPWPLWLIGCGFSAGVAVGGSNSQSGSRVDSAADSPIVELPRLSGWLFALGVQAGVCLSTVMRVSGFHFGM